MALVLCEYASIPVHRSMPIRVDFVNALFRAIEHMSSKWLSLRKRDGKKVARLAEFGKSAYKL